MGRPGPAIVYGPSKPLTPDTLRLRELSRADISLSDKPAVMDPPFADWQKALGLHIHVRDVQHLQDARSGPGRALGVQWRISHLVRRSLA